ncbi:MAG TPA: porin family protein [Chitinophagaceae bacterium]|nr:porin family protein [Chitinophagaceae bacterium]
MLKKVFLMLLGSSAALIASAQNGGLILKGGLNSANVSVTSNGRVEDAKSLTSFHVGVVGDISLSKIISFQPGILFTGKGSKTQNGQQSDANYYRATSNPYYVEVPANLVFKLPLGERSKVFFGAGPYLAVGVAGKNKVEGRYLGIDFETENEIEFSNDDPTTLNFEEGAGFGILRRFDYGLNGQAGLEFSNVLFSVNYGHGLAKLQSGHDNSSDDMNKHRVWSFSIGFKL